VPVEGGGDPEDAIDLGDQGEGHFVADGNGRSRPLVTDVDQTDHPEPDPPLGVGVVGCDPGTELYEEPASAGFYTASGTPPLPVTQATGHSWSYTVRYWVC